MNELWWQGENVHNMASLRFSTLTPNQPQLGSFGSRFSEVMNYSASSCQMRRWASCPGLCATWQCRPCLLCTPESVCTINTAAEVTAGPRGTWLSRGLGLRRTHIGTHRRGWRGCSGTSAHVVSRRWHWGLQMSHPGVDSSVQGGHTSSGKYVILLDQTKTRAAPGLSFDRAHASLFQQTLTKWTPCKSYKVFSQTCAKSMLNDQVCAQK